MSETFSILDCMLAPIFLRLKSMGIELPQQHCRPIFLYCHRIFSRPSFIKSMTAQEKTATMNSFQRFNKFINYV